MHRYFGVIGANFHSLNLYLILYPSIQGIQQTFDSKKDEEKKVINCLKFRKNQLFPKKKARAGRGSRQSQFWL